MQLKAQVLYNRDPHGIIDPNVQPDLLDIVAELSLEVDPYKTDQEICDNVFAIMNGHGEDAPTGLRSMSTGDLVMLDNVLWLCRSFGWKEIDTGEKRAEHRLYRTGRNSQELAI